MRGVKVKLFTKQGGLHEMETAINKFLEDKELIDIKFSQSQSYGSYNHTTKATAVVIYKDTEVSYIG